MIAPSTTAAVPCGKCYRCGGQLYAGLTHGCTTTVVVRDGGIRILYPGTSYEERA